MTASPTEGVEVTRVIPVPTSVSIEAQNFLAVGSFGGGDNPALDDADAWRTLAAEADALLTMMLDAQNDALAPTLDLIDLAGVPVHRITPEGIAVGPDTPVLYDIHGGALFMGSGDACRAMATGQAYRANRDVWSVDYRMPPDHPYPAALDDCMAVYRALLEEHAPERVAIVGGSAGGNLAAALMLRARDEGVPRPAALVLMSPECDLTESGDSFHTNLGIDPVLGQSLMPQNLLYAGGHDLTDPYLSPLFGDFTDAFPPTLLQCGTRDLFLSNTVRMHRKLRDAGVDAELHVWEAMPHGGFFGAPEDLELGVELQRFLTEHLD